MGDHEGRGDPPGELFVRLPLDELLATSDVVQLCVALTAETSLLIDGARLKALKPIELMLELS